jgi:1,4-alpha-glucan branching enzyme
MTATGPEPAPFESVPAGPPEAGRALAGASSGPPTAEAASPARAPESPLLPEEAVQAFLDGRNARACKFLGAHLRTVQGEAGASFAVWAPEAKRVLVIGDFNDWSKNGQSLELTPHRGIWHRFVPGVQAGARYKYHLVSNWHGHAADKADTFACHTETPPRTASVVWDLGYRWGDRPWLEQRRGRDAARSTGELVLAVLNFTPVPRRGYRVGVPRGGFWREVLNSDAAEYGGTGQGNCGGVEAEPVGWQHRPCSLTLTLPPLGALFFVNRDEQGE